MVKINKRNKVLRACQSLIGIAIISCSSVSVKNNREMSDDSDDSRRKAVFVYEYQAPHKPYAINDTISIDVKEAWIEHQWKYTSTGEISKLYGYQIIILCNSEDINKYPFEWTIGTTQESNFRRCSKSCIIADLDSLPGKYLRWEVQRGMLDASKKPEIIGKLELYKKQ